LCLWIQAVTATVSLVPRPVYESPMFFLGENLASRRRHLIAVSGRNRDINK
jgi:hypothetical protein